MNKLDLGTQLENFVNSLVESGRYHSKNDVLREGVRLIQEREEKLAPLDAAVIRGLIDANGGCTESVIDVFDRLEAKYTTLAND